MRLTITMDLDNAAFESIAGVARLLANIAERTASHVGAVRVDPKAERSFPLADVNGNRVGTVEVTP